MTINYAPAPPYEICELNLFSHSEFECAHSWEEVSEIDPFAPGVHLFYTVTGDSFLIDATDYEQQRLMRVAQGCTCDSRGPAPELPNRTWVGGVVAGTPEDPICLGLPAALLCMHDYELPIERSTSTVLRIWKRTTPNLPRISRCRHRAPVSA